MKNRFELFLKKARREIWLKAAIVGLSAAAFVSGGLLLTLKLLNRPLWYALAGIAALPIAAGLFLLLHRVGAAKVAQRLDDDFLLHEKVRTMVAFENEDGDMLRIQRDDAMRTLSEIPLKKLRFTRVWLYALLPAIACAVLVTALVFPVQAEKPPVIEVEPPLDVSDWEWQALDELIEYVEQSDADEIVMKPKTLTQLYGFKNLLLSGAVLESNLERFVNSVISSVQNAEVEAAEQEDISEQQLQRNKDVCVYVVNKLCEIFGLDAPIDSTLPTSPDAPDEPEGGPGDSNQNGTGDIVAGADEKLFDDVQGYVAYINVIREYYEQIVSAMDEGVLSAQEWSDYMEAYFEYLYGSRE